MTQVAEVTSYERANGGWVGISGRVSVEDYEANPHPFQDGRRWTRRAQETGERTFAGRMKTPAINQGAVDISAAGPAALAEREVERAFFSSSSYSDWITADSEPHNYSDHKRITYG